MAESLHGRAIIVTGASSGLGRAIALELGSAGAEMWLVGRSAEDLAETARLISAAGGPAAHCHAIDLRIRGPLALLIEEVSAHHPHLFALINNAGVMHPEPILSSSVDRWQAMLDINVMAMLEGSKAAIEAMRRHRKPGHIISVGSVQARFEEPGVYGLSKKAAEMIGDTLRAEVEQDDIRIAAVIPGGFATQLMRGFTPEQISAMGARFEAMGIEPGSRALGRIVGDPQHVARMVHYILQQPIDLNIQEVVIRPPVSTKA